MVSRSMRVLQKMSSESTRYHVEPKVRHCFAVHCVTSDWTNADALVGILEEVPYVEMVLQLYSSIMLTLVISR
jgi:hypothetical protein